MAFSNGGSQTGTDTDLTGMSNVNNITIINSGSGELRKDAYGTDTNIVVNGTLSINPFNEELLNFATTPLDVTSTGVLNINGYRDLLNKRIYTQNYFLHASNPNATANINGTVNWIGGGMFLPGYYNINNGSNVTIEGGVIDSYNLSDSGVAVPNGENQIVNNTTATIIRGLTLYRGFFKIVQVPSVFEGYKPRHCYNAIAFSSSTPNIDIPIFGYDTDLSNQKDVGLWQGCRPVFSNPIGGTNMLIGTNAGASASAFGFVVVKQTFNPTIVDENNQPLQNCIVCVIDNDNGNRGIYYSENYLVSPGLQVNSSQTFNYTSTTNAIGSLPTALDVYTGFDVINSGGDGATITSPNTGAAVWDYRGKNNDVTDVFEVRLASYGKLLTTYDVVLKGNVDRADLTVTTGTTVFSDAKITEYDATVVDAYPVTVTFNGTDLTITGDNTTLQTLSANQLYDVVSLYLANNYDKRLTPIVDINGTEIDGTFWDINITLDYITFDGSITLDTTRALTLTNGSTVSGGIIDINGDSFIRTTGVWQAFATEADRDATINTLGSGTSSDIFRFNHVAGTIYYYWIDGTKQKVPVVQGENIKNLSETALLQNIGDRLGFIAPTIYCNTTLPTNGNGSNSAPFNNIDDAIDFCNANGAKAIELFSTSTMPAILTTSPSGLKIKSVVETLSVLVLNGLDCGGCKMEELTLLGDGNASSDWVIEGGQIAPSGMSGFRGKMQDVLIMGSVTLNNNSSINGCSFQYPAGSVVIDANNTGASFGLTDVNGAVSLRNINGGVSSIYGDAYRVEIESTCTGGTLRMLGSARVTDNSNGTTVTDQTTASALEIINRNVSKSSKIIPANEEII